MPDRSRRVVPELPASSGAAGGISPRSPRPSMVTLVSELWQLGRDLCMSTPREARQDKVEAQSAPGAYRAIVEGPLLIAARSA